MGLDGFTYFFNSKKLKEEATKRRLFNINTFSNIDRAKPLQFGVVERFLLLKTTKCNEKIFIRYPGKEAARTINTRPLDFRPVLQFKDNSWMNDLSFGNIWDDISKLHNSSSQIEILAAIFFKMAYLIDYELVEETCKYYDLDISSNKIINKGELSIKWYKPDFNNEAFMKLQEQFGLINGCSLEAYLFYNDLLAQNEDCKYYYRNQTESPEKPWNYAVGRLNTMLTHLSVIQYLQNNITFSQIMTKFQRGKGVAPISMKDLETITNGLIQKENGKK